MAHWCESCGQQLPEGETPHDATWLGEPPSDAPSPLRPPLRARREQRTTSGADKKILLAVVGALALWGIFVTISGFVSPNDGVDDQVAAEMEQARIDDALEAAETERLAAELQAEQERAQAAQAEAESLYVDEDFVDADADRDISAAATPADRGQIERLQRELQRRGSSAALAYRSLDGVVLVRMTEGEAEVAELTSGAIVVDSRDFLLRTWTETFAINGDTRAVGQVVNDASLILTQARDGNSYFVRGESLRELSPVVEVKIDDEITAYISPRGHTLVPFDGLGIVALPQASTGDTLIAGVDGFTTLSPHRVLTANSAAMLEEVCGNATACTLQVTIFDTEEQFILPVGFAQLGDHYVLSPNGTSVLRYTRDGFAEVYEIGTGSLTWVVGAGMNIPAWGPNSDFVAWLDLVGAPRLKVMFLDERDWVTIELDDLQAPQPFGPELVVFAPSSAAIEGS